MNKFRIIAGSIILAVAVTAVLAWQHSGRATHPNVGLTPTTSTASVTMPPTTIAPARVIPPDVSQNMQQALAEREKKLQQLNKSSQ